MPGQAHTITVPHLGGSTISYKFGAPYNPSLPTLVMINSFTTSVELYRAQFADTELMQAMNLLAIEPYGHGGTRATYEQFTYWDSAIANLQVLDALGIPEVFVLGTSQGGWIAARMAMLAPDKVKGIIILGTSMDDESQRSRDLGPGVPPGALEAIFEPFQRLGDVPAGDGVGLGLAVARGLMEAMGGTLTAEETPGGGLTLVVDLPVAVGAR